MTKALHLALKYGQVTGWVYWYMATDLFDENLQPTSMFYAYKNYFRFIRPGFVQIESNSDDVELLATAFMKGNDLVVVLINDSDGPKSVTLDWSGSTRPAAYELFQTTQHELYQELGESQESSFDLPAQSITTFTASVNDPSDPSDCG